MALGGRCPDRAGAGVTPRAARIERFLARAGWAAAQRAPLAGDASARVYQRLDADGARAVLMDADPARGEDVRPFALLSGHLRGLGLSAPGVLAADADAGLLLIEDFGDTRYDHAIAAGADEAELYEAAVDALARLQEGPVPDGLPAWNAAAMAPLAAMPFDWYRPGLALDPAPAARAALRDEMTALLATLDGPPVLVLRDYHAQNLIWLADRIGAARAGLLDFQDGGPGHPAYDLVSLVEDARRDLAPGLAAKLRARFAACTGGAAATLERACAILGAQRNLRILGQFVRLAHRDGKPAYLDLMPRVWCHLQGDLAHPDLARLADLVARHIPEPTEARRDRLRARPG
jgi:aminoglycoside/choline kinase family phosphotransferase